MRMRAMSVADTLRKDHRVLERLADEFDRSRLRDGAELRRGLAAALEVVGPALAAHRMLEAAALSASPARRPPQWRQALGTAELQRDQIVSLAKDLGILLADPQRYRAEHLACLAYAMSQALRRLLAHEADQPWKSRPGLDSTAPASALLALRRVESMLGRL